MEEEDQKEVVGCEPVSFALLQGDSSCLSGNREWYIDFHRSHTRLHKCCIPIHGHHIPLKSLSGYAANHNNAAIHSYYACLQSLSVCFHSSVLPHLAISNLTHLFHHSDPSTTQSDHRLSPKLSHSRTNQKSLSPPTPQPLFTSPTPESTIDPELHQDRCVPISIEDSKTLQEIEPLHTPHQEGGDAISPAFATITFRGHALLPSVNQGGHRSLNHENKEDAHDPF